MLALATSGMVALTILVVVGLLVLASVLRLAWRAWNGDVQIESASRGRQLFGGGDKDGDTTR
jgi:hypothetical protein